MKRRIGHLRLLSRSNARRILGQTSVGGASMQSGFGMFTPRAYRRPILAREKTIRFSAGFESLSSWVERMQTVFADHGYESFYIGGSSAREILDHILIDAPLQLRDLDIYLIKGRPVEASDVEVIAQQIHNEGIAELGEETIRQKKRANSALNEPECYDYMAGFGAHMFAKNQPILSLGIFNWQSDRDLNGLFDIDRIFLHIQKGESLREFGKRVRGLSFDLDRLSSEGLTYDPCNGYKAWRQGNPQIINWLEIKRGGGVRNTLRMVRTFAKSIKLDLSQEFIDEYRAQTGSYTYVDNPREFQRSVIKIFGDTYWAHELKMLAQLNALAHLSPEFQEFIKSKSAAVILASLKPGMPIANKMELAQYRLRSCIRDYNGSDKEQLIAQFVALAPSVFGIH